MGTKRFNVQMRVSVQLQSKGFKRYQTIPMKSIIWRKSWNVFIKKLNFFLTEERKTWTSWMTWGWVNYQEKIFFLNWTTPLITITSKLLQVSFYSSLPVNVFYNMMPLVQFHFTQRCPYGNFILQYDALTAV